MSADWAEMPPKTRQKISTPIATRPEQDEDRAADARNPMPFQPADAGPATAPSTAATRTGMTIVDVWSSNQMTPTMISTKPTSSHDENPRPLSHVGIANSTFCRTSWSLTLVAAGGHATDSL